MITPEIQAEILTRYFSEKKSIRQIAASLGLNRRSVKRVVKRRCVQVERPPTKRSSILDPYKDEIKKIILKDESATAAGIMNKLRLQGFMGGQTVVNVFVKELKRAQVRPKEAFLRLEFAPGETAQVDWGEFGDVFGDGVKIHCFAMVLCFSRMMFIEFTRAEKFEDFIRCHETAFHFFGGVPKECWYDNLTSAVTERIGGLIKFNSRFMSYMGHHGIRPHACNVARGNEKGRVEGLIKYIRLNFWSGRHFQDFEDLTHQSIVWRDQIANQREHRATRKIVRLHFETEEQKALMPKNPHPYDTDEIISRVVPPDFHITYETIRYSVPWTLVGITVTLKIGPREIKFYYHERLVATHIRSYLKNKVFTKDAHRQGLLERKPGASRETWQVSAVTRIGPKMNEYISLLRAGHRSLRSELARILALATIYGDRLVHEACWTLIERGIVGVDALELTLKRLHHPAQNDLKPEPINFPNQKLNRIVPVVDLRQYDALLFESEFSQARQKFEDTNGNKST